MNFQRLNFQCSFSDFLADITLKKIFLHGYYLGIGLPRIAVCILKYSLTSALKQVLSLAINTTKSAVFLIKIYRNLPRLCQFYRKCFEKGHYFSLKEYSFLNFVI